MKNFVKRATAKVSKLAPDQVEKLFDSITIENEAMDAVIESLGTGLMVCNLDWQLIMSNKALERMIPLKQRYSEYRYAESVSPYPVWEIVTEPNIASFLKSCSQSQKNYFSEEFEISISENVIRILTINIMPLVQQKKMSGYILKVEDISEERKKEIRMRRMENLASLTNLAASVAHEIKNPLGAISIHIQLMQKAIKKSRSGDGKLPPQNITEHYLEIVNDEIERLNQIVVDFLYAVRPLKATLEPIDPNEYLKNFASFIRTELTDKNIDLELKLMEKPPHIMVDVKLFKQVLMNLVQNAIAAMLNKEDCDSYELEEKGSSKLWIGTHVKDDRFYFTIIDNGCGMNEETQKRIFEPYFTTKAKGTGLGMTMVYKIVREFSGDISVKSFLGEGTCFVISIPVPQKELRLLEYTKTKNKG
ncbi:MAG: two-component sensor histidine kinase [Treponema sp. CETP13]|nr:MAG: two-component sensor histidine kinase [Treponema sp. CETP13]